MTWIDHHQRSERAAAAAHEALRAGSEAVARAQFADAAAEEAMALSFLDPAEQARTFGITAVSAVALAFKAGRYADAERWACETLARASVPPFARLQLRELLQHTWKASRDAPADTSKEPPVEPRKPTVLIVEDDASLRHVVSLQLERRGFSVDGVGDGASAIRYLDSQTPDFAVLDLRLPDISGLDVARHINFLGRRTGFIMLTGYGSVATATDAFRLGAADYLTKPATVDEIVAALDRTAANADAFPANQLPKASPRG